MGTVELDFGDAPELALIAEIRTEDRTVWGEAADLLHQLVRRYAPDVELREHPDWGTVRALLKERPTLAGVIHRQALEHRALGEWLRLCGQHGPELLRAAQGPERRAIYSRLWRKAWEAILLWEQARNMARALRF